MGFLDMPYSTASDSDRSFGVDVSTMCNSMYLLQWSNALVEKMVKGTISYPMVQMSDYEDQFNILDHRNWF